MGEVVFDKGHVAEEVPGTDEKGNPGDSTNNIVDGESPVMHVADTGNERRKSTDNRYESGDDYGFASIFFVELMRFVQMAFLEYLGVGIVK